MDQETQEVTKTSIKPNVANMVKGKGGSLHSNDFIGGALAGLTLDQVKTIADDLGVDASKYDHLNSGQQRMNIGNRLRALVKKDTQEHRDNVDTITALSEKFKAENEAEAEAKKAAKAAEKAAEADAEAA